MNWVMPRRPGLRWPLPALLAWGMAWAAFAGVRSAVDERFALAAGVLAGSALAFAWTRNRWRRALIGLGFPLSWLGLAGAALPSVFWLGVLALLLLVYPLRAWRDAPWFPTPVGALRDLAPASGLRGDACVLDAGCGLGDGLLALREALPAARIAGIERSSVLAGLARRRCRFAQVTVGDMWRVAWSGFDLVYLFQRPESMARAWSKAQAEMAAGSWLASLEFEVPGCPADAWMRLANDRRVWLYRVGMRAAEAQPASSRADNPATARAGRGGR